MPGLEGTPCAKRDRKAARWVRHAQVVAGVGHFGEGDVADAKGVLELVELREGEEGKQGRVCAGGGVMRGEWEGWGKCG